MFRKSYRLFAAWSLLAVMALTVTPRELLHECGQSDGSHQGHTDGSALKNVCSICDVAVPVAIAEDVALVSVAMQVSAPAHPAAITAPALGYERRCADRGPPTV